MKRVSLGVVVIALMAITATPAEAASTRAEYVAQVDQVCIDTTPQFRKLNRQWKKLAGGKVLSLDPSSEESISDAEEKRRLNRIYRGLGRYTARAARVFGGMVERMALVGPAPGDEAAVAQWIGGLREFVALQAQSAPAWKHHKFGRAADLSTRSVDSLNAGGAAVKDFGITACVVSVDVPETTTYA
jgi:hypothetical protein